MKVIDVYITATITILGIAYPILLQVVARLDEKYASEHIIELLDKEKLNKWFGRMLVASLVFILIWTLKFKPLFELNSLNYLIDNSATILVMIFTTALVVVFILYVNKILVYYTPVKFIDYLIKKHNKQSTNPSHFNALTDIFLLSISKQNYKISQTMSRFFYDAFRNEREKSNSKLIEYPDVYYVLAFRTIEELAIIKTKKNFDLEYQTSGWIWLLSELHEYEISETTYTWLWRNILLAVNYEQDDMILKHWEKAHQYFIFSLNYINPEYEGFTPEIINKKDVEKREQQINRFLEFHYVLGGLLLYKKRYDCLKRIFDYTMSEPPRYVLLPSEMGEIFDIYVKYRKPYYSNFDSISSRYWFPSQNGIKADGIIKKWVSAYLAVLFLRQYTIIEYYIFMKPLAYPAIPKSQSEINELLYSLDFFKQLISENLDNYELIVSLKLKFLTEEWCLINSKTYPVDYINILKDKLKAEYEFNSTNQPISKFKIKEFYDSTAKIIEGALNECSKIKNKNIISTDYNQRFINGNKKIQDKDAFVEKSEVHHIDYESFMAYITSGNIIDAIFMTFLINTSKSYLIREDEIFSAIEKLNLNENYLLISVGVNIQHYIDVIKVKGLTEDKLKKTQLISFPGSKTVSQSIFVINKDDLPYFITEDIDTDFKDKYSLKKISKDYNIYASVLDLNRVSSEIKAENSQEYSKDELNKSVLLSIIFSIEIRWKRNIKVIQLIEYSQYREKGIPNNLNDIESL